MNNFSQRNTGFNAPPPSSRPPTKTYDRQSFVLISSESESILKFMKMHLNRYFSHIDASKNHIGSLNFLNEKDYDFIIIDLTENKKQGLELIKKMGVLCRFIPILLIDNDAITKVNTYFSTLILDIAIPPFNLDDLHCSIRRAINLKPYLKELSNCIPKEVGIADVIYNDILDSKDSKIKNLLLVIKKILTENIEQK